MMYDNRSDAIAATIPASIKSIQLLGYHSGGDGGGGVYRRLSNAPSPLRPWHFQSMDGAWWGLVPGCEANVKKFGAVGDGVADDTAAAQAAVAYLATTGGTLYFPRGKYRLTQTIDIDLTGSTSDVDATTINVRGDGSGDTVLLHTIATNSPLLQMRGGTSEAAIHIWGKWSGFTISGSSLQSIGVHLLTVAYTLFEDILTYNLGTHWMLNDVLSCTWVRCQARWGNIGFYGRKEVSSCPNALTFIGCQASLQSQHGILMNNGSALTWIGGSIEGNGLDAAGDGNKCAVYLNDPGYEGGVAATFVGTYFESNAGLASIRMYTAAKSVALNCFGCNFNSNIESKYVLNHIRIDQTGGRAQVNIPGCVFTSYNGYKPSTSRKNVRFYATNYGFTDTGAVYNDADERP
jgi:hypothetical protein